MLVGNMAGMNKRTVVAIAIAALSVELSGAQVPTDFRIIPAGEFRAWDGRPTDVPAWFCTEEDGRRIVATLQARKSARVIDYEHATLKAKESGAAAPAAGWFRAAEWRDDGVWLIGVDWTAQAAQWIVSNKYRYISPVFAYDMETGHVLDLYFAALTNDPGLDGLTDLAALAADLFLPPTNPLETTMDLLKKLLAALGLQESATETEALSAVAQLKTNVASLSAQVAAPDPQKFVPVATLTALQGENAGLQAKVAALSADINAEKLEQAIKDGLAAGKLSPATEAWARDLGKKDLAALSSFLEAQPAIAKPGDTQTKNSNPSVAVDKNDPKAIAQLAAKYQKEQADLGISVTTVQAVAHVTKA